MRWILIWNRARNQRDLNAKLRGSTLGDNSKDDSLDAKAWLKKQKKRAKEREREQSERTARELKNWTKLRMEKKT